MRIKFLTAFIIVIVFSIALSCQKRASGQEQRFDLRGKVYEVDKNTGMVTVSHETIPGFMEAMTMPFKIKDRWALDVLKPGDRMTATLVVDGERSWLEGIVVVQETSDPTSAPSANEPKAGDEVPDFTLVNQDGKKIRMKNYRGQALLLTFIYTRCPLPDYCPLMTDRFSEIDKSIRADAASYPPAHLLSISVDVDYDKPNVLREYGAAHTEDAKAFERWEFAVGTAEEVKKIATFFGLQYWKDGDQIVHSLRTALVNQEGRMVKLYRGNEWKAAEVLSDLKALKQ
ncbi:MAG: SCO family protein [Acidobacteriota bacterium]